MPCLDNESPALPQAPSSPVPNNGHVNQMAAPASTVQRTQQSMLAHDSWRKNRGEAEDTIEKREPPLRCLVVVFRHEGVMETVLGLI